MKLIKGAMLAAAVTAATLSFDAGAIGWPANYEGVMLQGFYWDSWNETGWSKLEGMADELSGSFKLIWVPNSAKAASNPGNGYDPVYWFTNHTTCWGTEAQLRSMIATFKSKGTGIIEDVVINHRSGATNWTDFPAEKWNGQTWKIGVDGICSTDEVRNAAGQATPTGAPDTGEDFNGSRDLDHTNANVQNNCKAYCKFLLEDMGYAGFRYDMVKGYSGYYTKIYNQYSKPQFSVGEYWDGNYDAVKGWIEATGKESAAFDFPFKYAVNEAFHTGDLTKLVWKANGTNNQPAGMIHFGYAQLAVTFVDNHDTYRDGSKFNGNVVAANAFMLCSPGTPCVFYPHWKAHKAELKKIIAVRNAVGVHNCSEVKVLQTSRDCYMAEVTGTKGKLVVKIGSAMASPTGYSNSDIKASGNDYCIWSKIGVIDDPDIPDDPNPGKHTIYFDNSDAGWSTVSCYAWSAGVSDQNGAWPGVTMTKVDGNVYSYTSTVAHKNVIFSNNGSSQTDDLAWYDGHIYKKDGSHKEYKGGGDDNNDYPAKLYIMGNLTDWDPSNGVAQNEKDGAVYKWNALTLPAADAKTEYSYFSFVTSVGSGPKDWDTVNSTHRYGASTKDEEVKGTATITKFPANVNASSAYSWMVKAGKYDVEADLKNMKLTLTGTSGVYEIDMTDTDVVPVYYNMQGVRVDNPGSGLYIVVRGDKVTKEIVR